MSVPVGTPQPPLHAFELRISIGAHTWEHAMKTIKQLANRLEVCGPADSNIFSGDADGSYSMHTDTRDVTAEQYREELRAWNFR